MDMTIFILLVAVLMLQVYSLLFADMRKREAREERKLDAKAEEAMEAEAKRSAAMDEGFENIMRFSVNGHDGFGGGI
jgi:hypothetical protein